MDETIDDILNADEGHQQPAQDLVDRVRSEAVTLVGPGGLLTGLTKSVLETALEVEMPIISAMTSTTIRSCCR